MLAISNPLQLVSSAFRARISIVVIGVFMHRLRSNTVPTFRPLEHALDCHLGFSASAGGKPPHLLASLTLDEKCELTLSGGLSHACNTLLRAHQAHDVSGMIRTLHKSGQFSQDLAPITEPIGRETFLREHDYVFVGIGGQRTFFNWRSPHSIQCNRTNASAQIDFHLFCQDYGLDLHRWRWDEQSEKHIFTGSKAPAEDVLTGFIRNSVKANGAKILELLINLTDEGLRQDDRNLCQYLRAAQDCATTFSSMFKPYVNVVYSPAPGEATQEDVLELAIKDYLSPRVLLKPSFSKVEPSSSLPTHRDFRQFFIASSDLVSQLSSVGAVTLQVDDCAIWCRPMSSNPFADQDKHLVTVLIQNYPDILDQSIRIFLPEAAMRIDAECQCQELPERTPKERQHLSLSAPPIALSASPN